MAELSDVLFIELAQRVGYPAEAELKRARQLQLAQTAAGKDVSLFDTACAFEILDAEQAERFERWAEQVARGEGPLVESQPTPQPAEPGLPPPPHPEPRVVFENAAFLGEASPKCEKCRAELDGLALMEGRAREEGGKRICAVCVPLAGAAPAVAAAPVRPTAPAKPAPPPAPSAVVPARRGTPSAGRVAAHRPETGKKPRVGAQKEKGCLGAFLVAVVACVGALAAAI